MSFVLLNFGMSTFVCENNYNIVRLEGSSFPKLFYEFFSQALDVRLGNRTGMPHVFAILSVNISEVEFETNL
jgi:hypothetical protein